MAIDICYPLKITFNPTIWHVDIIINMCKAMLSLINILCTIQFVFLNNLDDENKNGKGVSTMDM